jgi:uncharacterized protein
MKIKQTKDHVKKILQERVSGFDWWHTYRVWMSAKKIAKDADMEIVELASLLHAVPDWKFGKYKIEDIRIWLNSIDVEESKIKKICFIVENIEFNGENEHNKITSVEGKIVQDADWLDAIGAIGIARGFMFAGSKNLPMYIPDTPYEKGMKRDEYRNTNRKNYSQINHFHEKLLLIKDRLHTDEAREIAKPRHEFLEQFLKQFASEWIKENILE